MSASTLRKLQQARERLNQGDVAGAAYVCDEVLRRAPRNPEALWLLGTIRLMTNEPAQAAPLLERAVTAMPGHGPALENLGLARLLLGAISEAAAACAGRSDIEAVGHEYARAFRSLLDALRRR